MSTKETIPILAARISAWIRDYADAAGIRALIVGVSGGIDSAVVTRLCERTELRTICVAMPMSMAQDSVSDSLSRAMELCAGRKVEFHIRPIGRILAAYQEEDIPKYTNYQLLQGNLRSRIRANILYDFAGYYKGLVVGTGNMDEDEIGYFTKGGDGLVDICPLSKLHKSVVKKLGEFLQVPSSILEAKPSAGLWDGQTDEDELGMTYDEVEWALEHTSNQAESSRQQEVWSKVAEMRRKNAHKLKYPPVFDPSF